MGKTLVNLLALTVLVGAGYILMTSLLPSIGMLNKSIFPTLQSSINMKEDNVKKNYSEEDSADETSIIENTYDDKDLYMTKAVDGKGIIIPGTSLEMTNSLFWSSEYGNEEAPIMSLEDIAKFNNQIINKIPVVYDLKNYKDNLSKEELTNYINYYKIPEKPMYDYKGKPFEQSFYNSLKTNINLPSIMAINKVRYGITVRKTSLRSFPTESGAYNSSTNRALDRFQQTGCEPFEPVLVLHESKDKKWYFVQIYNYRGWIKSDTIALSDRESVFEYTNYNNFLMVTGSSVHAESQDSSSTGFKVFKMGTKLYLMESKDSSSYYKVKLAVRKEDGSLGFTYADISKEEDVSLGYLPYTRFNIITQAFKLQGVPYDWGDKYSGRDCSSFIMYIYKTFGINLPRNTDEQELCSSNAVGFKAKDSVAARLQTLDKLKPGAALYMPGHVMLYLGKSNSQYYIIHAFLGYSKKDGNENKFFPAEQIAVTTVQISNSAGIPFIEKLTSVVQFEF